MGDELQRQMLFLLQQMEQHLFLHFLRAIKGSLHSLRSSGAEGTDSEASLSEVSRPFEAEIEAK